MTIEEAKTGLKRLQASYPNMSKLDELAVSAYLEEIGSVKWDDFSAGMKVLVRSSKFFPTISEILDACDDACRKRLAVRDHEEREERLALTGVMDPGADIHKTIVGPEHQKFLDAMSGKIPPPKMEWKKAPASGEGSYKPISIPDREARVDLLKRQAAALLKGEA